MKRALAIAVAVCTLGFAGFSQIAIKGSWTASWCPFATDQLSSTLVLTYTVAGFDITSTTGFKSSGLDSQTFGLKGVFGPFSVAGNMTFLPSLPSGPRYDKSDLTTSFDFGGIAIGLKIEHWLVLANGASPVTPCQTPTADSGFLQYTFTGAISPISIQARFVDCCTGTQFKDLTITLTGYELCCGVKLNATFTFTKLGFDTLVLSGINVPLCCGVSLDVSITYSVTSKSVSITPKFAGIAEACFTVWGGPRFDGFIWEGIRVDGWRIRCTLGDCNYLEYVHAFAPTATTIPSTIRAKFICGADEYLELGFCGAGCCGGKYEATLRILWSSTTTGTLFGLRAFVGSVKIPVMTNFTLNLTFQMPAAANISNCPASFCIGWTFTF